MHDNDYPPPPRPANSSDALSSNSWCDKASETIYTILPPAPRTMLTSITAVISRVISGLLARVWLQASLFLQP